MSNDDDDGGLTRTRDDKKQENIKIMIDKYNVGTLQMFIKPEVLSMTFKERKKIDSIYYKRAYSVTNNEIIKSQKEYEKELELQNKPKEPIGQQVDQTGQRNENIAPVLPVQPVPPAPALPPPAQALALPKQAPMPIVARGGAGFDSFGDFGDIMPRNNDRVQGYGTGMGTGIGTNRGLGAPSSYSKNTDGILTRVSPDAEPFIASLIKFSNSGFPNNTTVTRMVDTFFNINLFRSFIKKLGEPIKLYDKQNTVVTDMKFLSFNKTDSQTKSSSSTLADKNEIFDVEPNSRNSITNWYPAQQVKTVIGSVYAFIYTRPSDLELRQQSDSGNQRSTPSMLMIKEGDNYRLIGGKIDKVRTYPLGMDPYATRLPLERTGSSISNNDETAESTVERQITEDYRKITAQSLPVSVSNTTRRFLYKPQNAATVLGGPIGELKAVIYSRQVTNSQIESIIESSRASSTDVVKVPINKLYYIVKNISPGILQVKIELDEHTKNILRLLFQILEKQNLLSIISGQTRKSLKSGDLIGETGMQILKDNLSESSINELESTVSHNIQFILDILFSKKMAFKYKGVDYIIDYLEWDKKFQRLNKVLENYKVAYYIDFNLFLEKLEKGKLPTDRDGTLFSSCAVRGAQLNNYWKKNFLDRNWTNFGKKLSESVQVKSIPSISDIIPGFIKKALNVGSTDVMSSLNAGVNQISLVQYCFMGQEELTEEFKNIDNSFAGVEWKNENSWNKRKERLFAAMDNCGSDIYCFQNVQCSLDAYDKIVNSLAPNDVDKAILQDISTAKMQKQRIEKYKSVLKQLLEKVDDPLNLIAQIYERYKGEYEFVYYFEQRYDYSVTTTMVPMSKKIALGNLTMYKKSKFELINEIDIRIAPFIKTHKNSIDGTDGTDGTDGGPIIKNIDEIYQNTSFATVIYCRFKEGTLIPIQFPGQVQGKVQVVSGEKKPVKKDKFPGFINGNEIASMNETELASIDKIPATVENDDVEDLKEEDQEEDKGEDNGKENVKSVKNVKFVSTYMKGGGDEDGGEWYNRDKSEETGFLRLFGKKDDKKPQTDTQFGEPCKKYTNIDYSPKGQIFGIINIKLETATTVEDIIKKDQTINNKKEAAKAAKAAAKAAASADATKTVEKEKENKKAAAVAEEEAAKLIENKSKETKELIEVLLVAAFISNFRTIYYLTNSTDTNPYFMVGDFNFSIPSEPKNATRGDPDSLYAAPALALLLSRSKSIYNFNNSATEGVIEQYSFIKNYKNKILKFIQELKIISYIHGGEGKNGRFRLLKNLLGAKFPLKNPDSATTSGLIFTTTKITLCSTEDMAKITRDGRQEGLPLFPNKVNPSNSEAIGGVFALDTVGVKGVVEIVDKKIQDAKTEEERAVKEAENQSIIASLPLVAGPPEGLMDVVKSPVGVKPSGASPGTSRAASPVAVPPVVKSPGASPVKSPIATPTPTPNVKETPIEPPVIDIKVNDLTKLLSQNYTASDKDIIKDLPSSILTICQTGKPMYDYLTTKDMSKWSNNDIDIYSDHAPIMYNINNPSNGIGTCGPEVSTSAIVSSSAGGMEGGAALENIKLITWNVGTYGGYNTIGKFYYHKFIGKSEEKKEQYYQRISNNSTAIYKMMKDNDYQYMLLQEGPNSQVYTSLNNKVSPPINYRQLFIDGINPDGKYTVISSETSVADKYSEFYLVVKNKPGVTSHPITSWGMMSVGSKNFYSDNTDNTVKTFFDRIIAQVLEKKIDNYAETDIRKDCARLWFFIDTENEQVLVSVHLSFPGDMKKTQYMHQRQQQVYILLNTIVSYFRNSSGSDPATTYKDYNIIFSGDFNINMLQPIPTEVTDRDFFECKDVAGQKTFIYTSKHNAPSSFGGQNEGKYNPTNIDFALVYPKPVPGVLSTAKLTSKSTSLSTKCTLDTSKGEITNILKECQEEIFKNVSSSSSSLDKMVSAIGTDYSTFYASNRYMPPGSATLLDIRDTPLINVDISGNLNTYFNKTRAINYMIQASPGKSGGGEYITAETLSNSVMNSLILATLNGVKNIIIPFIGGEQFYITLQKHLLTKGIIHDKNNHCKLLIKGVENYYEHIKKYSINHTIEKIYFSPYRTDEISGLTSAIEELKKNKNITTVSLHRGPGNMISKAIYDNSIDAIVNAANIELGFGTGISGMCFAAISRKQAKQDALYATKKLFIDCFKKYIQNVKTTAVSPSSPKPIPKPPTKPNSNECSHDMCKEYNRKIKLEKQVGSEKQKVGGCHAVMLYKTKNNKKYWSLLGKEGYGNHEYMMNLIGGKIDHPYKSNTEYVCIIDNMIKEIKEESKIDLNSEYNFNYVFKKDSSTTKTSVTDYNVIYINKDNFTNYIFYGIMGEYENEDTLKKAITVYNNEVKNAYNNKKNIHPSLCEMMYLNLIDFEYNPYTANGTNYGDKNNFTPKNLPKEQKFLFTMSEIITFPVLLNNEFKWGDGKDYISFYAAKFFKVNGNILFDNLTEKLESRGPPKITKDKRATIDNFIYMQKKGMLGMSNFETAIDEINKGQKKTHWMWYIIPSNLDPYSKEATFFKIDTRSDEKGSLTAEQYLDNEYLRNNYIKIIVAIYEKFLKLKGSKDDRITIIKTIIGPGPDEIDYKKLINSIEIFYPLLKTNYAGVDGVSKITEFCDVLKDLKVLDPNLKLPTSSTSSVSSKTPAAAPSKAPVTSTPPYQFYSVPIENPIFYCYQAAAFQLLFSIDSIRNHASNYTTNQNNISGNTLMVLKEMDTNVKRPDRPAVRKKDKQDLLAETAIVRGVKDTQQDSQEFLGAILNNLISETPIKDEITFWQAQYSFCKNSPVNFKNENILIEVNANNFEIGLVNGEVNTIVPISYNKRKQLMDIQPQSYNKFGELIGVGGISETVIMACQSNDSNINSTIQQILDSDPYNVGITQGNIEPLTIGKLKAGSTDCPIMTQKEFIKIPEPLKYMCFYKSLLRTPNTKYTFATCKDLTINNIKFKLRGYISHYGIVTFDNVGQQKADSGHYVYVGIENNKQVLYNDGIQPRYLENDNSEYITKGYVFLYERVVPQGGGGSNTIVSTLNPSTKSTVKANSNKKYNKRTRKHVNKITHKLKDTINTNTNTNTNKTKNKKKTKKHIHKNTVIAQ